MKGCLWIGFVFFLVMGQLNNYVVATNGKIWEHGGAPIFCAFVGLHGLTMLAYVTFCSLPASQKLVTIELSGIHALGGVALSWFNVMTYNLMYDVYREFTFSLPIPAYKWLGLSVLIYLVQRLMQ